MSFITKRRTKLIDGETSRKLPLKSNILAKRKANKGAKHKADDKYAKFGVTASIINNTNNSAIAFPIKSTKLANAVF